MADEKVSQMLERVTSVLGTDLLPIVGNTSTVPVNYRVQVKNFLNGLAVDLPQTTVSTLQLTANITANAQTATFAAGELILQANSNVAVTVQDRVGLIVRNRILNGNSNVTGMMWGAHIQLDTGNSNCVSSNTFGLMIEHTIANTSWARLVSPRAFIGIKENAGTGGNTTTYLMDIGAQGNVVSANLSTGNATVLLTNATATTCTHKLRIRVNGTDYWLMIANTN